MLLTLNYTNFSRWYNLTKQEKPNYCIPACIQAVLKKHQIKRTQTQIAKELVPRNGGFMFDESLKSIFDKANLGYHYFNYNEVPFNDEEALIFLSLNGGADVMLGHKSSPFGLHVSLVTNLLNSALFFLNPDTCKEETINIFKLSQKMARNKLGGFGVVRKRHALDKDSLDDIL